MAGCSSVQSSGIDPTGEHFFAPPPPPTTAVAAVPSVLIRRTNGISTIRWAHCPWDDVAVTHRPREALRPVGSEVIVDRRRCGADGYLRTNRRLEWSIDAGSVGQFVAVERTASGPICCWAISIGRGNHQRLRHRQHAARDNVRLNRGTCRPEDDITCAAAKVGSRSLRRVEGTSHVTVFAPEVYNWDARLKTAVVHWVDAEWQFPPPAINPAGTKHVFTTSVTRHSNQSPCENWIVRYEIIDGPPAGFLPPAGHSRCTRRGRPGQRRNLEKQPASRREDRHPGDPARRVPGAGGQRLVVGNGTTTKTWSAPDLAVHVTGRRRPASAPR